jgi:GDP-mannose 6-dehydrogenase
MKIVICGLGYVGITASACLLKDGHRVVGIDVSPSKAAQVNAGRTPVLEAGVGALLAAGRADGRLSAATAIGGHLDDADLVLVCVGTPSLANGALDLSSVRAVMGEIGAAVRGLPPRARPLMVVVRSTLPPGSMDGVAVPALVAAAGEPPGARYEIAFNPEFLRETTAVADYYAPARIVIGERAPGTARRLYGLYDGIEAPLFEVPFAAAEFVKLADNAFHALKVSFANEIGRLALELDVSPTLVADMFLADTKLNVSAAYLRPGGPFGGSCLPKDLRAINALASSRGVEAPVLAGTLRSNDAHKRFLAKRVMDGLAPGATVLLLGLSYKTDTDDMRESPLLDLAETLLGKGVDLRIVDPDLEGRELVGANLRVVERQLPHLSRLLVSDVSEVSAPALVVRGKAMPGVEARLDPAWPVVDLVRL